MTSGRTRSGGVVGVTLGILLTVVAAQGQGLDNASADALAATLRSLQARRAQSGTIPDLDPRIHSLADSPELTQELYEVAGQVFSEIAERSGGDPAKMNEALARGTSNPSAFTESLSPATRERLLALARKLPPKKP